MIGLSSCGTSELQPVSDKSSFVFINSILVADAGDETGNIVETTESAFEII